MVEARLSMIMRNWAHEGIVQIKKKRISTMLATRCLEVSSNRWLEMTSDEFDWVKKEDEEVDTSDSEVK